MNRLKRFILELDKNDEKYAKIYEGPLWDSEINQEVYDPTYWYNDIGFEFQRSNKFRLDLMCVLIHIPKRRLQLSISMDHLVLADNIYRQFICYLDQINDEIWNSARPKEESGFIYYNQINNEIHYRNACYCIEKNKEEYVIVTILVQAPYHNNKKLNRILCTMLPKQVDKFLQNLDYEQLNKANEIYNLQNEIRSWLHKSDYCCFIANGSKLTEQSSTDVVPFLSPVSMEIEICGIRGMGIKKGVTVITGGGYSGKSTLLEAINSGINNHIEGDGRELVITDDTAVFIAAEDGRAVNDIDISPFIRWIPNMDPVCFSTIKASGSTSQAANIIEAYACGSRLLLIDEDKSATNFMIRDKIMDEVISREPIIPFTDQVKRMYCDCNISTILVIGGSGEYLSLADTVIKMDEYIAYDITKNAHEIVEKYQMRLRSVDINTKWQQKRRYISYDGFSSYPQNSRKERVKITELGTIILGDEIIKTDRIYNITSMEQVNLIVLIIRAIQSKGYGSENEWVDIESAINEIYEELNHKGIDSLYTNSLNLNRWLELPRKTEIFGVINRMRFLKCISKVVQ